MTSSAAVRPCLRAFWADWALPASVRGPVLSWALAEFANCWAWDAMGFDLSIPVPLCWMDTGVRGWRECKYLEMREIYIRCAVTHCEPCCVLKNNMSYR